MASMDPAFDRMEALIKQLTTATAQTVASMTTINSGMANVLININKTVKASQKTVNTTTTSQSPKNPLGGGGRGGGGYGGGGGRGGRGGRGGGGGGLGGRINTFGSALRRVTSPLNLVGAAAAMAAVQLGKMWKSLEGFSYGERSKEMWKTIGSTVWGWFNGIFLGFGEAARVKMETVREFGGRTQVPGAVTTQISKYASIGIDVASQTRIAGEMYRIAGYGAAGTHQATQILATTKAIADKNAIGANDLMKSMAQHTDLLANAANRVPGALAEAVIQAQRMGVAIQTSEGFANKITGDFETYLDMQARLQTVMPGVDLTNVMLASQYGSTKDIQTALKSTFAGMDIGTMPRSIRQMISSTTGISEPELVKLGTGERAGVVKKPTPEEIKIAKDRVGMGALSALGWKLVGALLVGISGIAMGLAFWGRSPSWKGVVGGVVGGVKNIPTVVKQIYQATRTPNVDLFHGGIVSPAAIRKASLQARAAGQARNAGRRFTRGPGIRTARGAGLGSRLSAFGGRVVGISGVASMATMAVTIGLSAVGIGLLAWIAKAWWNKKKAEKEAERAQQRAAAATIEFQTSGTAAKAVRAHAAQARGLTAAQFQAEEAARTATPGAAVVAPTIPIPAVAVATAPNASIAPPIPTSVVDVSPNGRMVATSIPINVAANAGGGANGMVAEMDSTMALRRRLGLSNNTQESSRNELRGDTLEIQTVMGSQMGALITSLENWSRSNQLAANRPIQILLDGRVVGTAIQNANSRAIDFTPTAAAR